MVEIEVTVNGEAHQATVEPRLLLVHLLRDVLRLTGTHIGCVVGRCGACTVLWRNKPVKSCMVLAVQADRTEITTVEGLAQDGELSALQESFWAHDAAECGYCTPGMLMAAQGLLLQNRQPTEAEIKRAIAGNLCRCTGYLNIVEAVRAAAYALSEE